MSRQADPKTEGSAGRSRRMIEAFCRLHPVLLAVTITALLLTIVVAHQLSSGGDRQETLVLGQSQFIAGASAPLRVVVRNRSSHRPISKAEVRLALRAPTAGSISLGAFVTDRSGTLDVAIPVPALEPGRYELEVEASSKAGQDWVTRQVDVMPPVRLMLASDRPAYQPGESIHLKAMVRHAADGTPIADKPVTFEITDSHGNKVWRETRQSSDFGVAVADVALAKELGIGRYAIRGIAGGLEEVRTILIQPLVAPRFTVTLQTDSAYYMPGRSVAGFLTARYPFDRTVVDAQVRLSILSSSVPAIEIASHDGRTDALGHLEFSIPLPRHLPDKELNLVAEVRDTAGRTEQKSEPLTRVNEDLEISVIAEAHAWVPDIENILYILTRYADGRPIACRVVIDDNSYDTDADGVAIVRRQPAQDGTPMLVTAYASGNEARLVVAQESPLPTPSLLVRTDKPVYSSGEAVQVVVVSPKRGGTVFVDLLDEGRIVLTRSLLLTDGRAEAELAVPPSLAGMAKINAYLMESGPEYGHSRLIYVKPSIKLQVHVEPDRTLYRPGETANLKIRVTDGDGRPVRAAIGIHAGKEKPISHRQTINAAMLHQFLSSKSDWILQGELRTGLHSPGDGMWAEANPKVIEAFFALAVAREPRTIPVEASPVLHYLSPRHTNEFLRVKGAPQLKALREDADLGYVIRVLTGETGDYSLRIETGPGKRWEAERRSKAFFRNLSALAGVAVFGAIMLLALFAPPARSPDGRSLGPVNATAHSGFLAMLYKLHGAVTTLVVLPFLLYPMGIRLLDSINSGAAAARNLLGIETAVVLTLIGCQQMCLACLDRQGYRTGGLKTILWVFLGQFVLSRSLIVAAVDSGFSPASPTPWIGLVLIVLVAPVALVTCLRYRIRRTAAAASAPSPVFPTGAFGAIALVVILAILGQMLVSATMPRERRHRMVNYLTQMAAAIEQARLEGALNHHFAFRENETSRPLPAHFSETLSWSPHLITDDRGQAEAEVSLSGLPRAWDVMVETVDPAGEFAVASLRLESFENVFLEAAPLMAKLGARVHLPVTAYNYSDTAQEIELVLEESDAFEVATGRQLLRLESGEVQSAWFSIKPLRLGAHGLRVFATDGGVDPVQARIKVEPAGRRIPFTIRENLQEAFAAAFHLPDEAIAGSPALHLNLFSSTRVEAVESVDVMLSHHGGLQALDAAHWSALAVAYRQAIGRPSAKMEKDARLQIERGYNQLLELEAPGGGIPFQPGSPPSLWFSARALLAFSDIDGVYPLDAEFVSRTRDWLCSMQNADGSWDEPARRQYFEIASITALAAWALAESGDRSEHLERALEHLRDRPDLWVSAPEKAAAANAFLTQDKYDPFGIQLAQALVESGHRPSRDAVCWDCTTTGRRQSQKALGTTAWCAIALQKSGVAPQAATDALTWIAIQFQRPSRWTHPRLSPLTLRALLMGAGAPPNDEAIVVEVLVNERTIETFEIPPEGRDVMRFLNLTEHLQAGENRIELRQGSAGEIPFQLTGEYWLPNSME